MKWQQLLTETELEDSRILEIKAFILQQKMSGKNSIPTKELCDVFDISFDELGEILLKDEGDDTNFEGIVDDVSDSEIKLKGEKTFPKGNELRPDSANISKEKVKGMATKALKGRL